MGEVIPINSQHRNEQPRMALDDRAVDALRSAIMRPEAKPEAQADWLEESAKILNDFRE